MSENEAIEYSFKILLLGDTSVGKTCFLKRYIDDTFQDAYLSTIGFDYKFKIVTLKNGKKQGFNYGIPLDKNVFVL